MSTLATLMSLLERKLGEVYPITSGNLTTHSATVTLSDTGRAEANNWWNHDHLYLTTAVGTAAPYGEERRISDFYSASTITVTPGFTTSGGSGYEYEIRQKASRQDYVDAVNGAIRRAEDGFIEERVDETTIIIYEDQFEYDLPSGVEVLYRLDLEQCDVVQSGTASATSSTTLTDDTKSWTASEFNDNYAVVIIDGTGQGQQRTITAGTTEKLTVAEWTTTPDTTSDYIIKYIAQEELRWAEITQFDPITTYSSGTRTRTIHFFGQLTPGMAVRIHYGAKADALSATTDTTSIPDAYIETEGMAQIHEMLASRIVSAQKEVHMAEASYWRGEAERIKENIGWRPPPVRMIDGEATGPIRDAEYPF